jgi:hypothetical protein
MKNELTKEELLRLMLADGFTPTIEKKTPNYGEEGLRRHNPLNVDVDNNKPVVQQLDLNQ